MKKFNVYLWSGCGYSVDCFAVEAFDECHALEVATAEIVNSNDTRFFEEIESEWIEELKREPWNDPENDPEGWMYIDATIEGASRPVYIRTENLKIEEV